MISSPVVLIGCPRSGTTLLFNILSEVPQLWSIGYESKAIIERYHAPAVKNWESGALEAADLTGASRAYMLREFERQAASGSFWQQVNRLRSRLTGNKLYRAIKRRGRSEAAGAAVSSALPQQGLEAIRRWVRLCNRLNPPHAPIRLLEKTPENCLRLPFLAALFPDLRVIYLTRDGRANVHSLMEGWRQPHLFPGYPVPGGVQIPGDRRGRWAFTLIPGWQALRDRPLEEVCAWQWVKCNEAVLQHRDHKENRIPYWTIRYEDLVANPGQVLSHLAEFLELPYAGVLSRSAVSLPQVNAVSEPDPEKWRKQNGAAIERMLPILQPTMEKLGYSLQ
jgi:hypothetical protein